MRRLALATFLGICASAAQAGACEVYRVPLKFEGEVAYQIMVVSGADCRIAVLRAAEFAIEANEIIAGPRHGGARVDGTAAAYYRSNPGYRGADAFAFNLCGSAGGKMGCSTIRVKVQVR